MKATLTFNLPEEKNEFTLATKGGDYYGVLWDLKEDLFRGYRKHGYNDQELHTLLEKLGHDGYNLMEKLESMFHQIMNEHNVDLNEVS